MRVLYLEPFYGGSHRDVADNIVRHSAHEITLLTLPARFWKWRMRSASLWFARRIDQPASYDLIVCTGLMDVAALKSLLKVPLPPVLLYCHETQLSYPSPSPSETDLHFAFTDVVNMLCADHVAFNSRSHRTAFLNALPGFLRQFPEQRPTWARHAIEQRSSVCYPGISVRNGIAAPRSPGAAPLVIWNHRWELDKAPEAFFAALRDLAGCGCDFRVALLGENYKTVPEPFVRAKEEFGPRVVQYGYVPGRHSYERWLQTGAVVVSTAIQENFGISVMEAVAHGCHPVLPHRLSYPELIPAAFHGSCLYDDHAGLVRLLRERLCADRGAVVSSGGGAPDAAVRRADPALITHARAFRWEDRIAEFDALFEGVAHAHGT